MPFIDDTTSVLEFTFERGDTVVWRSVPDGAVSYAYAGVLVADTAEAIAIHQPTGSACKRRTGARGGPRNSMLPGGWDGGHRDTAWDGPPGTRVHIVGTCISVIRTWDTQELVHTGWYVNIETPWRRTALGFDSRDLILDLVLNDDLTELRWKDKDQLDWAVEVGLLKAHERAWIWQQARQAEHLIEDRVGPFQQDWSRWAPAADWAAQAMPPRWSDRPLRADIGGAEAPRPDEG